MGRQERVLASGTGDGTIGANPLAADPIWHDVAGLSYILFTDRAGVQAPGASDVSMVAQSQAGDALITCLAVDQSKRTIM